MATYYLSQYGLKQLNEEIKQAKEKSKEILKKKAEAFSGDTNSWHDNAAFDEAVRLEYNINADIENLINIRNNAIIVGKHYNADMVDIDDTVYISLNNQPFRVKLTGNYLLSIDDEEEDLISTTLNSPIGSTIYKRKVGEKLSYAVDKRVFNVTINDIVKSSTHELNV